MVDRLMELAERCEAAEGPDDDLDQAIGEAMGTDHWSGPIPSVHSPRGVYSGPRYTASIDAAMTLVPEGADWRLINWPRNTEGPRANALVEGSGDRFAATPALALCAAALRARASKEGQSNV